MARRKRTGNLGRKSQARRGSRHHNTGKRSISKTRQFNLTPEFMQKVKK